MQVTIKVNILKERKITMKNSIVFAFISFCICLALTAGAAISPAVDIISGKIEMKRCLSNSDVLTFSGEELDNCFGEEEQKFTVTSLPSEQSGVLSCGAYELEEGQTLTRDLLSMVKFVPSQEFEGETRFSFSAQNAALTCIVDVSQAQNSAPVTADELVETQKNIAVFSTFAAADPDNDKLSFEIVKYPKHGSVGINDADGMFVYRPKNGYIGGDSFIYKAVDVYGNESAEQKVQIKVSKPACNKYFSDMENHWAHNAAVKMAATGLMGGEISDDGSLLFNPDGDMTRGDFLALSLIVTGHEKDIPYTSKTVFADNSAIPSNIRSYAQYAYDNGIINGYSNGDGSINFESLGSITRAEAAVITEKILKLDESTRQLQYTDAAAIPTWASSGISSLTACGILKGEPSGRISPSKILSRAEGAQMICNAAQYLEDREKQENKNKKSIFNLFGLLG